MGESDREERIRLRAYYLWEADGMPEGRDGEHWDRACELTRNEEAGGETSSEPAAADAPEPESSATANVTELPTRSTEQDDRPPAATQRQLRQSA
jgi:hypothetical protein